MNPNNRSYRATFILDNRGKEESIDQIIDGVKHDIAAVHGEVTSVENLGRREFVRVTDRRLLGATYVQVAFSAPATGPAALKERLRLNTSVYRTFVTSV
jgi:small subunit ribosomal protein S6